MRGFHRARHLAARKRCRLSSRRWTLWSRPTGSPTHLGEPDLAIVDASWHMPATGRERPRGISRRAHPRRALPRHRRAVADRAHPAPHMLPPAAASSARRWSGSASAATTASSSTTIRRCAPRRAAGSCSAISARSRSRSSTAASRNGSPKAGRSKAASRSRAPRRFDAAERGRRGRHQAAKSAPASALPLLDARGRAALRRQRARPAPGRRRRPHPGRAQPAVRRALQRGRHLQVDATRLRAAVRRGRRRSRARRSSPAAARASPPTALIFAAHLLGNARRAALRRQLERMGRRSGDARRRSGPA